MKGGYQISNKLKKDLIEVNKFTEINESIAFVANLGKRDKADIISNSNKIKKLVNKWIGEV